MMDSTKELSHTNPTSNCKQQQQQQEQQQHQQHQRATNIVVKSRDSLLTTSRGYTNYRGILNLVIILLLLSNARAALENVIKYGILVDPLSWFAFLGAGSQHKPALAIMLALGANCLFALGLEKIIALKWTQSKLELTGTHLLIYTTLMVNLVACITLPAIVVYVSHTHPISASLALMLVSIVFLKLVSYHMMNYWCRNSQLPDELHSRTTRAFLRSYVPPCVEIGTHLDHMDSSEPSGSSEPPATPVVAAAASTPTPSDTKQELRKRAKPTTSCAGDSPRVSTTTSSPTSDSNNDTNNNHNHNGGISSTSRRQTNGGASPSRMSSDKKAKVRQVSLEILARYPANLSLANMCAYMMFPTLCYELEYAQTRRVRKHFLIKRLVELIALSQLDIALIQQWIVPTVSNSILPFKQMQFTHMLERLLKLAIPNHVIWLIWFYLFFHSLLNIIAELTRFADREFYRDWWNSESVNYFWSNWNIPVHKWCARHLYVPLIAVGLTKCQASTAVFFVSAFFHEYLVSVPLKMFRMWAFAGMLMQLPWARFVSSYFNNNAANVAVWLSLIIGQPLCILMYYHDYYVINHVVTATTATTTISISGNTQLAS